MRGSPLLRALVAFAILALLSVPVRRLTRAHAEPAMIRADQSAPKKSFGIRLTFSHLPRELRVLHLGTNVWTEVPTAAELERVLKVEYPDEGIELEFQIAWPEDVTGAMRIRATDPSGQNHDRTIWGRGNTEEVAAFP